MTGIAEIRAAIEAATPGPWGCFADSDHSRAWWVRVGSDRQATWLDHDNADADAHLIANAPTWLAELVGRVERSEQRAESFESQAVEEFVRAERTEVEVERLRGRLRAVERYAAGLHFAGRLDDEKIVRAALENAP